MNVAAEILVIILSVFLAIFLILGIIMSIYLISLTRQIRKITSSAGQAVDGIGSIISRFVKITSPMFAAELAAKLIKMFKKDKEEK